MKTPIRNLLVAFVVTCVFGSIGFAQEIVVQTPEVVPQQNDVQGFVQPQVVEPYVQPVQQNPFYFGMQVELRRDRWGRTTLRIVGVTQGSPAQRAGLEFGDEIRSVNGLGFQYASDSFDAVRLVNQYVTSRTTFGAPILGAPAAALTVAPLPAPPVVRLVVRNVRNGRDVVVTVYPTRVGYEGVPAAAAALTSER